MSFHFNAALIPMSESAARNQLEVWSVNVLGHSVKSAGPNGNLQTPREIVNCFTNVTLMEKYVEVLIPRGRKGMINITNLAMATDLCAEICVSINVTEVTNANEDNNNLAINLYRDPSCLSSKKDVGRLSCPGSQDFILDPQHDLPIRAGGDEYGAQS